MATRAELESALRVAALVVRAHGATYLPHFRRIEAALAAVDDDDAALRRAAALLEHSDDDRDDDGAGARRMPRRGPDRRDRGGRPAHDGGRDALAGGV